VHCVVHIARTPLGRTVSEVVAIDGFENGHYVIKQRV